MPHLLGSEFTKATSASILSFCLMSRRESIGYPAIVVIRTRSAGACSGSFACGPQPASSVHRTSAKRQPLRAVAGVGAGGGLCMGVNRPPRIRSNT